MSVLVECYSVIVRRFELQRRYPGGLAGYEQDCANRTLCADTHLVRVGFMAERDIRLFILRNLTRAGLASSPSGKARDLRIVCRSVAIVEQGRGPWHPDETEWLAYAVRPDGVPICWLKGTPPGELSVPRGWTPEPSPSFVKLPASIKGTPLPRGEIGGSAPARPGYVTLYQASAYPEDAPDDGE